MANYVISKSAFGDYWVGRTKKLVKGKNNFGTLDEAIDAAIELTDSKENTRELEDQRCGEEEVEMLDIDMERWII